ncbi:hypothetical protein QYF50_18790 [Paenibacillus vini]|nr:hypothetical protein [Paenibacillus vini]MDN4069953.1 hypothetical protein [Paenibacillus vini]
MNKETAYYGMAIFIRALIKAKLPKKELKSELSRIIDDMYKAFK